MAKTGRKGLYDEWITEDGCARITEWAREGHSNEAIYKEFIGISDNTFYEWLKRFPQIKEALKKGRAPVGVKVEDAFYSRCDWKEVTETKEEMWEDGSGKVHKRITKFTRMIPPDATCLIFALKNLYPYRWRDKQKEILLTTKSDTDPLSAAFKELENKHKGG